MENRSVIIYGDGACSGNPGPGGWGSIVSDFERVYELGAGERNTTNNRMEMSAVLESLRFLLTKYTEFPLNITIFTDSVYVIRGATQWLFGWKKRGWKNSSGEEIANPDLWQSFDEVLLKILKKKWKVNWKYVRGHTGIRGNERCDEIAVAFSKCEIMHLFQGSASEYAFDIRLLPKDEPLPEFKNKSDDKSKPAWYLSYVNGKFQKHQSWKECEAVVKGRPAKFKKVTSFEEEEAVKKSWGIN